VYLPPGRWFAYQTGKPYPGGRSHRVPAALEDIPVFVREGTVLPLLADGVMTLLPSVDPRVPGLAAARSTLKLACYPGPRTALRMADGAVLVNHPPAGWNGDGQVRTATLASGPKAAYRAAVSAGAGKWEVAVLGAPRALREVSAELR
jgi:alpha-D-xyloside xylohydrolase